MRLLPWAVWSAFLLLGLLPNIPGRLCCLLAFTAKNPGRFGPQHPRPQACAAPTGEEQARVRLAPRSPQLLASGQAECLQLQSLPEQRLSQVCFYLCPPLAKPLRQRLSRGLLFRILLPNSSSQERKNPLCRARPGGWQGERVSPLPSPSRLLAEGRESSRGLGFFSQALLPPGSSFQKVITVPNAHVLCLAFKAPGSQSLFFPPSPPFSPDPAGLPQAKPSISSTHKLSFPPPAFAGAEPLTCLALPSFKNDQQTQGAHD